MGAPDEALREASYGRFDGVDAALADPGLDPWWRVALDFASWLAGLREAPPTVPSAPQADPEAAALAIRRATLSRLLSLDKAFFDESPPEDATWASARAWRSILRGEPAPTSDPDETDPDRAALVIERCVQRTFTALNDHALDEATSLARRASRMARTEGLPQSTYLANVALARIRRLNGHPWLAARILRGLAEVAPPAWHPWLGWEMTMAAGSPAPLPAVGPAEDLVAALTAARAGDESATRAALESLGTRVGGFAFLERDLATVRAALDRAHAPSDEALGSFAEGALDDPPYGMVGLAGLDEDTPDIAVCFGPREPARRVLWIGARGFDEVPPPGRVGRTETALAVLAFAGDEGLAEAELFRRAYGFAFERELHKGVLGVLVHRMRGWADTRATVHREDGHMRLEPHQRLVIADPRCERPTESRVLVLLGRHGLTSAKQAAKTLSISVRSAQAALQALVEDGALERVREGRSVGYVLEDTTFEEPTRH